MTRVPLSIAADHPAFAGHFPSRPVVPGVVLLDACLRALVEDGAGRAHGLASAKFVSMVRPGEPVSAEFDRTADGASIRVRVWAGRPPDERLAASAVVRVDHEEGVVDDAEAGA